MPDPQHPPFNSSGSLSSLLKNVPLFHALDDALIEPLSRRARRRKFAAHEALFHEGDPGHTMYIVLEGRVRICKTTASGQTVHIAFLDPGDYFGEMALIDGSPRMADAATVSASDLLMLDREELRAPWRCRPRSPSP